MNPTDLETLNRKFYEYIQKYCEKVNITLIIDESDLLSPTAENSNNVSNNPVEGSVKTSNQFELCKGLSWLL